MIMQFSDTVNFIIILIILICFGAMVGYLFKITDFTIILLLFALIVIYLYLDGVISGIYGAIGFIVIVVVVYVMIRKKGGVNIESNE